MSAAAMILGFANTGSDRSIRRYGTPSTSAPIIFSDFTFPRTRGGSASGSLATWLFLCRNSAFDRVLTKRQRTQTCGLFNYLGRARPTFEAALIALHRLTLWSNQASGPAEEQALLRQAQQALSTEETPDRLHSPCVRL